MHARWYTSARDCPCRSPRGRATRRSTGGLIMICKGSRVRRARNPPSNREQRWHRHHPLTTLPTPPSTLSVGGGHKAIHDDDTAAAVGFGKCVPRRSNLTPLPAPDAIPNPLQEPRPSMVRSTGVHSPRCFSKSSDPPGSRRALCRSTSKRLWRTLSPCARSPPRSTTRLATAR